MIVVVIIQYYKYCSLQTEKFKKKKIIIYVYRLIIIIQQS